MERTLRQWHSEDGITFHDQKNVYFSQCSRNRTLSLSELLRLTSDIAVEDYRQQGFSREHLLENHYAILVSRVSFRIHSMPRENQHITVSTWEEKREPLQLKRAYEITDEEGRTLVSGLSCWLVVDPVARKLMPTKNFTLKEDTGIVREHDCMAPGKITIPAEADLLGKYVIRFSDLDSNGHTNNARYGGLVMDYLPAEFQDRTLKDIRINYSKEAMSGDELELYGAFTPQENKYTAWGRTGEGNSFECELYF